MIRENLDKIDDLEFRIERAERRDMDELAARLRHTLSTTRFHFLTRLLRRRESHEDDTYCQRARRWNYDQLIEEQQAALKDDTRRPAENSADLTIGDLIEND